MKRAKIKLNEINWGWNSYCQRWMHTKTHFGFNQFLYRGTEFAQSVLRAGKLIIFSCISVFSFCWNDRVHHFFEIIACASTPWYVPILCRFNAMLLLVVFFFVQSRCYTRKHCLITRFMDRECVSFPLGLSASVLGCRKMLDCSGREIM